MARAFSATLLAATCLLLAATAPHASAQLDMLPCLDCSVTIDTVDWNGSALPGQFANGTFRITNTGQFADSYTITVSIDNDTWTAEPDPTTFADVPPGAGPLASDDNTRDFVVRALVPQGTQASATASIQISVQSDSTEEANAATSVIATAGQVYAWSLTCTDTLPIQKTERDMINLTATNLGNGPDSATITPVAPTVGIVPSDPQNVQAAAGGSDTQAIELGVGLTVDDGEHALRFDLKSRGDPTALASCTTLLQITGGTPSDDDGGGGDGKDSPSPAPMLLLSILAALAIAARRRRA